MNTSYWFRVSLAATIAVATIMPGAAVAQNLIVGEYWNNRALEFAPDGTSLGTFCASGETSRFYGMAFDSSGYLYVAGSFTNNVRRFSPTGVDLGNFVSGPIDPTSVAFDQSGNLYVGSWAQSNVRKYSPTGDDLGVFATAGLSNVSDIAFDSSGNLFVSSFGTNSVHKFSSTGVDLGKFATALSAPQGLAFDAAGNLYVTERGTLGGRSHDIRRFSPTGVDLGAFGADVLLDPVELAFGQNGDLFVSDFNGGGTGNIRRFSSTGIDLGNFASGISAPSGLAFRSGVVPEPSTMIVLTVGGLAVFRKRRKK